MTTQTQQFSSVDRRKIERCLEDLREMRANGISQPYAMVGASGSGKSSLMKAGVLPRLRREARVASPSRVPAGGRPDRELRHRTGEHAAELRRDCKRGFDQRSVG